MDVDVDARRRRLDDQGADRRGAALEVLPEGLADDLREVALADDAAPGDHVEAAAALDRPLGIGEPEVDAGPVLLAGEGEEGAARPPLEDVDHPLGEGRRRQREELALLVAEGEVDLGVDEREAQEGLRAVADLGRLRAHELPPRRHVGEEAADLDLGADRHPHRHRARGLAGDAVDLGADGRAGLAAPQGDAGDRGHARQGLAAEAEGDDVDQVLGGADLRGAVAGDRHQEVVGVDAGAVVDHPDAGEAAVLELDVDPGRARVDRVLHRLLDHRGRTLDDLAGGDLIGQRRVQELDAGVARRLGAGQDHGARR
ncbi:MAG: hypothetical protein R3B09_08220 [Nannocystaceae bacterium]